MPKLSTSFIIIFALLFILSISHPSFAAKGLRTEELGNSEKREIAEVSRKIRDNPDDGDIVFASSLKLIEINHVKSFGELMDLYEKAGEIVKAKIIKAIGQQRDKGVIDAASEYWRVLSRALDSTSEMISREVVKSLALLESEEFFDKLLEELKSKDSSATLIDNIVKVLCMFKSGPSGEPILTTKTIGLRVEAVKALFASQGKNRTHLLNALGEELGEEFTDLEKLEKWWQKNREKDVLQIILEANRRIQARSRVLKEQGEEKRLALVAERIERLKGLDEENAKHEFLKKLKDPGAEPEVLVFVIKGLGRLKTRDSIGRLRELLESEDIRVRVAAIEALGEVGGDGQVVAEVAAKLSASNSQERLEAANTVSKLGGRLATRKLLERLNVEKDRSVMSTIILGLGRVGSTTAITPLVEFVAERTSPNLRLRETVSSDSLKDVANALGGILVSGHKSDGAGRALAIKCLMAMLGADNKKVRFAAIDNLGSAGAQEATGVLVETLNRMGNAGIRAAAARALGKMPKPGPDVVNALLTHLNDSDTFLTGDCMRSLRYIVGLNGSRKQVDLDLLLKLTRKLRDDKGWENTRALLKNLPEERIAKQPGKGSINKLYRLKGRLAEANIEVGDHKGASAELEKVVVYNKWSEADLLEYLKMLAHAYKAQGQLTKANDVFDRIIKIVRPPQAERFWKEKLNLIRQIGDYHEKVKWINAELAKNPPPAIREELKKLR